jgi:hypothetical protein
MRFRAGLLALSLLPHAGSTPKAKKKEIFR